jgi:hypothetical protein
MSLTSANGPLATGIDSLQFFFQSTGVAAPNSVDGCVIKELEVFGTPTASTNPLFTMVSPQSRQVLQRNASNRADVSIRGWMLNVAGAQRIQARAVVMAGTTNSGTTTAWSTISTATNGAFAGVLHGAAAGGWYSIQVQAVDGNGNVLATAQVDRVGVGDIFITAGQSNAACFGSPQQTPADDRVSAYTVAGNAWKFASDPQPNPSGGPGTGGSPWPILGSLLVQSNSLPVGFVSVAWGGTSVSQWQPGSAEYLNLKTALQALGPNGVRAVLWHQGEEDSAEGDNAVNYAEMLYNVVAQSRLDAGWNVPWGIAEVSYNLGTSLANEEAVAAGHRFFLSTNSQTCFRGPRTDDFNLENECSDGLHFNNAGLHDHAQQWFNALNGVENPELLTQESN